MTPSTDFPPTVPRSGFAVTPQRVILDREIELYRLRHLVERSGRIRRQMKAASRMPRDLPGR